MATTQQQQLEQPPTKIMTTEELILPPPSCWFNDDFAAAAPSSSGSDSDESICDGGNSSSEEEQPKEGCVVSESTTRATRCDSSNGERMQGDISPPPTSRRFQKDSISSSSSNSNSRADAPSQRQSTSSLPSSSPSTATAVLSHHHHHNKTPPLASFRLNPSLTPPRVAPSPSWKEISSQVLPSAAKELLTSSLRRIAYTARVSYAKGRWHRKYSDLGNNMGGFFRPSLSVGSTIPEEEDGSNSSLLVSLERQLQEKFPELPPFSNLPWVDRQMVREWRTYLPEDNNNNLNKNDAVENTTAQATLSTTGKATREEEEDVDFDFDRARTLVPQPLQRPRWQKADICHDCCKPFGPTRLRHHCRLCGKSFCQMHSGNVHPLPHLGYDPDVPERVCDPCKRLCLWQNLAERVAWRLARCRDLEAQQLTPYFETGIDSLEQAALRIAHAALATARSIPLGAQAHVAVETVEVLRKHGLNGIYGIMLRKEFLAAADLLRKALGINKTAWPLSVHELSAAIFYALAQHRAMRGINPDREEIIHTFVDAKTTANTYTGNGTDIISKTIRNNSKKGNIVIDETDDYNPEIENLLSLVNRSSRSKEVSTVPLNNELQKDATTCSPTEDLPFTPVCTPVPDHVLNSLIFYAPIALTFIYATKEVDMQLLAAQQGWKLLYACLNPDKDRDGGVVTDVPASAVFVHEQQKTACLAIRGTATIHDIVTDLRQVPVPFPEMESTVSENQQEGADEWTNVTEGKGLAVCGMASAAMNLFREHIDVLLHLVRQGYKVRITGHSLGGGVATLIGVLILKEFEDIIAQEKLTTMELPQLLRVYAYGPPSSVDANLADFTESFVTVAVLHDDVVPRLTPTSCRGLLKHLLHIRETWVRSHLEEDLLAIGERASLAWAPRWRSGFTMTKSPKLSLRRSSRSIKKFCQKKLQSSTKQFLSVAMAAATGNGQPLIQAMPLEEKKQEATIDDSENTGVHIEDPISSLPVSKVKTAASSTSQDRQQEVDEVMLDDEVAEPKLLVEVMGGLDNRSNAVIIDGEEFFEADENLIESEEDSLATTEMFVDAFDEARSHELDPVAQSKEFAEVKDNQQSTLIEDSQEKQKSTDVTQSGLKEDDEGPGAVVLEEVPLPRMFIPGKIVHVYSHRGVFKAAYVPRAFRELRRISLAGNMLSDHTTQSYYESLLELRTVRYAQEFPPRWTAFDEDDTCSCCASRFTWASTSNSEAQNARDKHNCRSCGTLVCNPCAMNRIPLSSIGLTVPVRVCDRCYNDLGGVFTGGSPRADKFGEENRRSSDDTSNPTTNNFVKPERQRDRRSTVVDDLARRIKESSLA